MSKFKKEPKAARKKKDKDKPAKVKKMPKSVQEVLDFDYITTDGIIIKSGCFSKLYSLTDSNFVTEQEDRQAEIVAAYEKFVNRFPDMVTISIVIVNKRCTTAQLVESYHLKEKDDKNDIYRQDYNGIIDKKIEEGRNDIAREKYLLFTVRAKTLEDAQQLFNMSDTAINDSIKPINGVGVDAVEAIDRLRIMREILCGNKGVPFEQEFERYFEQHEDGEGNKKTTLSLTALKKSGVSVKDLISPQAIAREKTALMLDEDRFCKSFAYVNLPQTLDTSFLTAATSLPYEMVTVIQLRPVPHKKAINLVKNQNTSIKADVIKESQRAYKSGYDPSLMNEDLQHAQIEAKQLREDVVNGGKKLFYATMVVTVFAETEDELEEVTLQQKSKCADFSLTPSSLIGQQVQALNTAVLIGDSKVILDRLLTSQNACALFPFNNQELRDRKGYFYGTNAVSKNMIIYDRKRSSLANGLFFGQSGSGKSFFTKGELVPNLLDTEDDMIILDPENEYRVVADAFGGTVIDLEVNSDYHLNPCDMSMEWNDPKAAPLMEKCDYMVGLVESIMGKGRECSSYDVNAIHRACNKMYEPYMTEMRRRHGDGDNRDIDPSICPTLVDFYQQLLADGSPEGKKLAAAVEAYCVGNYNLFAHHTNVDTNSRLIVYNLLYLPEKMREPAMKVCLSNIWSRVVKNREMNDKNGTSKAVWVYLDEFHYFFNSESSANSIMAYYKRVRKYNGIMTGITQDVSDLLRSQQGTAMFNNTGFFVFLKQSSIGRQQIQQLFSVSDTLIDYTKDKGSGIGLIYNGRVTIPFNYRLPTDSSLYKMMSTNPNDEKKSAPNTEVEEVTEG